MLDKQRFFEEYRTDDRELKELGLDWKVLAEIHSDYLKRVAELTVVAETVSKRLGQISEVHSLKSRIKDPAHLIEKIIRKRREKQDRQITLDNYQTEITDLVGVRALHLFKDEWAPIHQGICECWHLVEEQRPTAYIRKGDVSDAFSAEGCEVREHERGYRSVHYLIKCQPTKTPSIVEIQVRTLFEEGWSEIDHRIAYPYSVDDQLLSGYLAVFNVLAGNADQMATYVRGLRADLAKYREAQAASGKELGVAIARLEKLEKELGSERGQSARLKEIVESLRVSSTRPSLFIPLSAGATSSPVINTTGLYVTTPAPNPFIVTTSPSASIVSRKVCKTCGTDLGTMLSIMPQTCPKCFTVN